MTRCAKCGYDRGAEASGFCPGCEGDSRVRRCVHCGESFAGMDLCPTCGMAADSFPCDQHPDRTAVGRCIICDTAVCRQCETRKDRTVRCSRHAGISTIQGWAEVYRTSSEFDAQLVQENLHAEGIEARLFSQKDLMLSVDLGELSIVRVLVPAWDYLRAEALIRRHSDEEGEVSFACGNCGEAYETGATSCAACGAPLSAGQFD